MLIFPHTVTAHEETCEEISRKMSTIFKPVKMKQSEEQCAKSLNDLAPKTTRCKNLKSSRHEKTMGHHGRGDSSSDSVQYLLRATKSDGTPFNDANRQSEEELCMKLKHHKLTMKRAPQDKRKAGVVTPKVQEKKMQHRHYYHQDECSEGFGQFPPPPYADTPRKERSPQNKVADVKKLQRMSSISERMNKAMGDCMRIQCQLKSELCWFVIIGIAFVILKLFSIFVLGGGKGFMMLSEERKVTLYKYLTESERFEYFFGSTIGDFLFACINVALTNLFNDNEMN